MPRAEPAFDDAPSRHYPRCFRTPRSVLCVGLRQDDVNGFAPGMACGDVPANAERAPSAGPVLPDEWTSRSLSGIRHAAVSRTPAMVPHAARTVAPRRVADPRGGYPSGRSAVSLRRFARYGAAPLLAEQSASRGYTGIVPLGPCSELSRSRPHRLHRR